MKNRWQECVNQGSRMRLPLFTKRWKERERVLTFWKSSFDPSTALQSFISNQQKINRRDSFMAPSLLLFLPPIGRVQWYLPSLPRHLLLLPGFHPRQCSPFSQMAKALH